MEAIMPIMMNVKDKECVVVGGGQVAERKIKSLMDAKANITVISPIVTAQIKRWEKEGILRVSYKKYQLTELGSAFVVIAATDQRKVNLQVYEDAKRRRILVSVVDCPECSDFIFPATMRRGKLHIAISTSGASPSVTKKIKNELEFLYGEEYELYLDFLSDFRAFIKKAVEDTKQRQAISKDILKIDIIGFIRTGKFQSFRKSLFARLEDPEFIYEKKWIERYLEDKDEGD
ncbi:precorrin-2 dehydrogenase/sirohydrochlorin ferrochelatase family protein [Chengkuizengella axinellae]|uniref:precorrin-2 dehydrogenase n=1 Tax=Chengkuizengella axinellae TaxID=3064388 RepID=A0ABT9ITL2_9BACL|nr:NAD(P)-dependent oxidoreductase [Chengkuizengella sp. 2205SS18-9]MDP5272695.1 NAD(P)-dependent oxidoreductase [Chengkuizengella sp. 2205SS18-9]